MANMREELLVMIHRYQNLIDSLNRSIAEETSEIDRYMLIARREAYRLDVLRDLKNLLKMLPEEKNVGKDE